MTNPDKVRENRLRRMAERQGYKVSKSRRRDTRAIDYGEWWVVDMNRNRVFAGDIDSLERWLMGEGRQ
jgi:hypothetical protein